MTIARLALRLLVSQAIKGTDGARPTIAEGRVYDSRISPEQPEVFGEDAKPTVIVLTDADEGDALSDQNGGPPFGRMIDVVLDIGMVLRENAPDDGDGYFVGYPNTDARLEASIDLLQAQIMRYLSYSIDPLPILFQNNVRIWKQESHRHVEPDSAEKIARRLMTLTCQIKDDDFRVVREADAGAAGLDLLPEPARTIAKAMPAGSSAADIFAKVAAAISENTAPDFEGVDMTADIVGDEKVEHEVNFSADPPQE